VAAAPGARTGFDAGRVPPLGDRGMPGRAGSPVRGPAPRSGDLAINAEGYPARPAQRHEDSPVPRPGDRTPRRPDSRAGHRRVTDLHRPCAEIGLHAGAARTALRRAVLAEHNGSKS
jgi:hypothetical protein